MTYRDGSYSPALICCGRSRGVVYVDTPHNGSYGILFCPRCDFAHDQVAGPPIEHLVRDVHPRP